MSINIDTSSAGVSQISWESLLGKIGDVQKTAGADGKEAFTITMKDGDATRTYTIGIPDDLETPNGVDQAAIETLCAKLVADKSTFNLSDEDIAVFKDALTKVLTEVNAGEVPKSAKGVMFDLYRLMALLVEVAQKQRDAAREQRQAENVAIQTSILAQASQQRTAAIVSMIASVAACAVQVIASGIIMKVQTSAFKTQMETLDTSGVKAAKTQLAQDVGALKEWQSNVMKGANNRGVPLTPEAREAKIASLQAKVLSSNRNLESAQNARSTDESYLNATRTFAKYETVNNIVFSLGNVAQSLVQNTNALFQASVTEKGAEQKKEEENLDQTRDLFNHAQELVNEVVKLMQAVVSAETQSMRDAIQV